MMAEMDSDTIWEVLNGSQDRVLQCVALEELSKLILQSESFDDFVDRCSPELFVPLLSEMFLDSQESEDILLKIAHALTNFLNVSAEWANLIVSIEGAVKAICNEIMNQDITQRTNEDLAEQCIKVLELVCVHEAESVFKADGRERLREYLAYADAEKESSHIARALIPQLEGVSTHGHLPIITVEDSLEFENPRDWCRCHHQHSDGGIGTCSVAKSTACRGGFICDGKCSEEDRYILLPISISASPF